MPAGCATVTSNCHVDHYMYTYLYWPVCSCICKYSCLVYYYYICSAPSSNYKIENTITDEWAPSGPRKLQNEPILFPCRMPQKDPKPGFSLFSFLFKLLDFCIICLGFCCCLDCCQCNWLSENSVYELTFCVFFGTYTYLLTYLVSVSEAHWFRHHCNSCRNKSVFSERK